MILKTYSFQTTGVGSIVLNDDASDKEIAEAVMINAREEHGNNGKPMRVKKEEGNGEI